MTNKITKLVIFPCIDSPDVAQSRRRELEIGRNDAASLGRSAVDSAKNGYYRNASGEKVDWRASVQSENLHAG